jgi:hypothetical protein
MIQIHCHNFTRPNSLLVLGDYAYQQFFLRFPLWPQSWKHRHTTCCTSINKDNLNIVCISQCTTHVNVTLFKKPSLKKFPSKNHYIVFYSPPQQHSSTHAIPLAPNLHKFFNKLMSFFIPKTTQRNWKQIHNNPIYSYVYHCFLLLEASL